MSTYNSGGRKMQDKHGLHTCVLTCNINLDYRQVKGIGWININMLYSCKYTFWWNQKLLPQRIQVCTHKSPGNQVDEMNNYFGRRASVRDI